MKPAHGGFPGCLAQDTPNEIGSYGSRQTISRGAYARRGAAASAGLSAFSPRLSPLPPPPRAPPGGGAPGPTPEKRVSPASPRPPYRAVTRQEPASHSNDKHRHASAPSPL